MARWLLGFGLCVLLWMPLIAINHLLGWDMDYVAGYVSATVFFTYIARYRQPLAAKEQ